MIRSIARIYSLAPVFLPVKSFTAYWSLWEISIQSGGGAGCGFCSFSCWLNRVGASRECGMGGWLVGWAWGSSSSQGDAAAARSLHLPHHQQQAAGSRWAVGGGQPQPLPAFFVLRKLWHKANNNSPAVKVVHYLVVFVGLVKCQLTISLPRCLFNCHIETKSNGKDENDIAQIIYKIWSGEGGIV